jgi:hypothetical protein
MASVIDTPLVAEWLRQFDPADRPAATRPSPASSAISFCPEARRHRFCAFGTGVINSEWRLPMMRLVG